MKDRLKGVQQIQASARAFAAVLIDGSVVTRGHERYGGDSRAVRDQLKGVLHIQTSGGAFAAISSYPERRMGCYLGLWWQQLCCARSAARLLADAILFSCPGSDPNKPHKWLVCCGRAEYGGGSCAEREQVKIAQPAAIWQ